MAKYIEREAALKECDWYANEFCECEYAIMPLKGALENLPAADAIEELQEDNAALNGTVSNLIQQIEELSKPSWIPVTDRLPEIRKVVLITDGIDVGTGWMNQGWWNTSFADIQRDAVTHWMPLPQAPKEE